MPFYPHGSLEVQGVGDLVSITELQFDIDNKAVAETTMKSAGAGFSFGQVMITGSFTVKNATAATEEKDWIAAVRDREILGITIKLPNGNRIPVNMAPEKSSFKDQEQGASTTGVSFVGFTPQTQG